MEHSSLDEAKPFCFGKLRFTWHAKAINRGGRKSKLSLSLKRFAKIVLEADFCPSTKLREE